MKKCKNCNCDCHCDGDIHGDVYGLCTCENCKCREVKNEPEGLVVDETGECESCQQEDLVYEKIIINIVLTGIYFLRCSRTKMYIHTRGN